MPRHKTYLSPSRFKLTEEQLREQKQDAALRPAVLRLEAVIRGWIGLVSLPNDPLRAPILRGLTKDDRKKVLEIEAIYLRGRPPDADSPPRRRGGESNIETVHGSEGHSESTAQADLFGDVYPFGPAIPLCAACGRQTLRTGSTGAPLHSACEPRHTYATAPSTSWKAGERAARGPRSQLAQQVLAKLRMHPDGLTDDEIAELLLEAHRGSVSKRRHDLCVAGLVEDSGRTRPTRWGRQAVVWVAV